MRSVIFLKLCIKFYILNLFVILIQITFKRKRPRMSNPKMSNPRMSNPRISNPIMSKGDN